jgi:hypothetical protein
VQELLHLLPYVFEECCAGLKKTGVPAKYIAMAAPDWIDFDLILDQLIPSFVSPIATTPLRIGFTTISDVMLMIYFRALQEILVSLGLFLCTSKSV